MTAVYFCVTDDAYTIRFAYNPLIVDTIKAVVPSGARNYSPTRKEWTVVGQNYAQDLMDTLHYGLGLRIVGFRVAPPAVTDEQFTAELNQILEEGTR